MNSRLLKSAATALCCFIMHVAFAQCPDSTELNITATLYTQENGLTSNMLMGTAKDSTGYLYFLGLDGKWLRFDGAGFRIISDISRIPFYNYSVQTFGSRNYTLQYIGNIIYKADVQVSSNTDNMMEALSDIVWAINTRNDRFDNVVNRMRAFAIEILEPSDITVQFNVSKDISDVHLDMQQRKNIYLIFKEAVNNIVKYSGCKNVLIDISRQGNKTFVMNIKDDGKGFEVPVLSGEEKTLSGNGIRNMKKRAEELGGEMTIDSFHGRGTTLHLKFII